MTRSIKHGFTKGKACLTNLINFHNGMTSLLDEGKEIDIVYLDSSKASGTFSHNSLTQEIMQYGLDEQTVR